MAEWSSDLVLEFLELYAAEPVLYDPKHPYHKNKKMINNAWQRIQQGFGVAMPVSELKKKKDSLMASFRYQMRRKKEAMQIGEPVFQSTWFAFNFMYGFLGQMYENEIAGASTEDLKCLQDVVSLIVMEIMTLALKSQYFLSQKDEEIKQKWLSVIHRANFQPSRSSKEPVLEFVGFDALEDNSPNNDSPTTPPELNAQDIKQEVTEQTDKFQLNTKEEKTKAAASKRKQPVETELQEALDQASTASRNDEEDECDLYGKLIAKKLRKLPESQRERMMYEIQGLFLKCSQYR